MTSHSEQRRLDLGSPSVLMMFYHGPGQLESELAQMDECMPHYYKITCGHGQGAEKIMRAEAALCREDLRMHRLSWNGLMHRLKEMARKIWRFAVIFLAWRLALAKEMKPIVVWRGGAPNYCAIIMLPGLIWSGISAYYYALLGESEKDSSDIW